MPLVHHSPTYVDNVPGILLTQVEEEQLCKQHENTLIMKFSAGIPRLSVIRDHIAAEWHLETPPAVGYLDPRHVTIHMGSTTDTNRALARMTNKVNNSLFRLFRWTPDFKIGKESSFVAVRVKFYDVPLHYYNVAALHILGSLLGNVVGIHPSTLELTQQVFAKVCNEMDVTKPFLDTLWIGTSRENGWSVPVEYEGNNSFCNYCGLLGHTVGLCKKKRQVNGTSSSDKNEDDKKNTTDSQEFKRKENNQWEVKGVASSSRPAGTKEGEATKKIQNTQQVNGILKRPSEPTKTSNPELGNFQAVEQTQESGREGPKA